MGKTSCALWRTTGGCKKSAHEVFVHHFRLPRRGEKMAHDFILLCKSIAKQQRSGASRPLLFHIHSIFECCISVHGSFDFSYTASLCVPLEFFADALVSSAELICPRRIRPA